MLTSSNYEVYIIDYLDGKLSPLEVAELLLFLEQNPTIKAEFESLEGANYFKPLAHIYPDKEKLKKHINLNNQLEFEQVQNLLIAKIEGDLRGTEEAKFSALLKRNKDFSRDYLLYFNTKLHPDLKHVFEDKESLKKKTKVIPLYAKYFVAASLLLAILILPYLFSLVKQKNNYSQNNPVIEKSDIIQIPRIQKTEQPSSKYTPVKKETMVKKRIGPKVLPDLITYSQNRSDETLIPLLTENEKQQAARPQNVPAKEELLVSASPELLIVQEPERIDSAVPEKAFLSLRALLRKRIKDLSKDNLQQSAPANQVSKVSAWELAALAARVFSKTSGNKVKLKNMYNAQGELKQYAIVSDNFEFSKSR
jgi:hypothetical protein